MTAKDGELLHSGNSLNTSPAAAYQMDGGGALPGLRRLLVRLALDSNTPGDAIKRATDAIREVTSHPCAFIEGEVVPEAAPGYTVVPVYADGCLLGALLMADAGILSAGMRAPDLGEIADLVGVCLVTANQAQTVLELQEDSEAMLFHAPDAIFVLDEEGVVQMANRRARAFVDADSEQVVGQTLKALFGHGIPSAQVIAHAALANATLEVETSGNAGSRLASLSLSVLGEDGPVRILCVARDITAEKQAELALRRTERATLMGQAVSYILHEVNNPLAALMATLAQVKKRAKEMQRQLAQGGCADACSGVMPGNTVETVIEKIGQLSAGVSNAETASLRIRDTMAMLRSSRLGTETSELESVDVTFELGLALGATEREYGVKIPIERDIRLERQVKAAPLRLAEAFGAILRNAQQAVEHQSGGAIQVVARESQSSIRITISDNGPGVPEHLTQKIFMPFFTTKPIGKALGLGLTIADDTIRRFGGTLKLVPTKGPGARFEISLPL